MSFDRLAPHYRWMEWVLAGRKLQHCRTAFLPELRDVRRALLLGEGNGRFAAAFVEAFPSATVTIVDASAGMLCRAKERVRAVAPPATTVEYVNTDIFAWDSPIERFDLIATHFFFDCFRQEQVRALIPRLSRAAGENAVWLNSDFRVPPSGIAHWRARWIVATMYLFFGAVTDLSARRLPDIAPSMESCGFSLAERRFADWGLLKSELWRKNRPSGAAR